MVHFAGTYASVCGLCYWLTLVAVLICFVAEQIEDYLVKIDHSMLAPKAAEARTGYQMAAGQLLAHTTTDLKDTDPDLIDPCDDFEPKSSCPKPAPGPGAPPKRSAMPTWI